MKSVAWVDTHTRILTYIFINSTILGSGWLNILISIQYQLGNKATRQHSYEKKKKTIFYKKIIITWLCSFFGSAKNHFPTQHQMLNKLWWKLLINNLVVKRYNKFLYTSADIVAHQTFPLFSILQDTQKNLMRTNLP